MAKILIIIPAYNEENSILRVYNTIKDYNKKLGTNYSVVVINDGSKDKTGNICEENNIPHINLVHNLGIGGAVQTGYKYALENGFDIAVQFDGDGQHNVEYIKDIINPILNENFDFVIGSRFVQDSNSEFKSSKARQMGIKLISFAIKLVTHHRVYDTTSGFRAVNKRIIIEFVNNYPIEYPEPITTTELIKKGYCLKEVGVNMNEREEGTSSIHSWKNVYYMINVALNIFLVKLRRYR